MSIGICLNYFLRCGLKKFSDIHNIYESFYRRHCPRTKINNLFWASAVLA
ncbi:hypothetical protein AXX16_3396 [Serratia rubidaea]|nr:hypothetical protein AXX16_3396 [Serratia rubidaea]